MFEVLDLIFIDLTSADFVKGCEVDYVCDLIGEIFKLNNPLT